MQILIETKVNGIIVVLYKSLNKYILVYGAEVESFDYKSMALNNYQQCISHALCAEED
jgi:hypothetical protein